jgi:hypothetical protein
MKIRNIQAHLETGTLRVIAGLEDEQNQVFEAVLPARETAALLPREILTAGDFASARDLIPLMNEILERLALGRQVRVWEYEATVYCSFLRWRKADLPSREEAEAV